MYLVQTRQFPKPNKIARSLSPSVPRFITIFWFLVLFFAIVMAYNYPPHAEVNMHNDAIANLLLNSSCINKTATNYDNPIGCAEAELLTAYPSVDYRISAEHETFLLWRYAYYASSESKKITLDGCTSYYHKTYQNHADIFANFTAIFQNKTYSENITENPFLLPAPLNELNKTQGENITLNLSGEIVFYYILDKTISTLVCDENGSCSCKEIIYPSVHFNITRNLESTLIYEVEGGSVLHFLSKPVLHEQWAKNSKFEEFVFSKRKFFFVNILLNNKTFAIAEFYSFNITNGTFNEWRIFSNHISNLSNMSMQETDQISNPAPIQKYDENFSHIYVFDSQYSAFGRHNITLVLSDHFGNNFSEKLEITNRVLTINNEISEEGDLNISNSNYFRPSVSPMEKKIIMHVASMGILGLLILIVVVFH